MSLNSHKKIDQKEYLKKYLSGDKNKKKSKKSKKQKTVKIVDDDCDNVDNGFAIDEELLLTGEDAPQIVGEYIEENPKGTNTKRWKSIVIKDEEESDNNASTDAVQPSQKSKSRLDNKAFEIKIKKEKESPQRSPHSPKTKSTDYKSKSKHTNKNYSQSPQHITSQLPSDSVHSNKNSDLSPLRKPSTKNKNSTDQSPPRRRKPNASPSRRHENRYDHSPPRRQKYSPSPAQRNDDGSDQSPPRRRKVSTNLPRRYEDCSDQSPPRRRKLSRSPQRRHENSSNQSPPRRSRHNTHSANRKYKSPKRDRHSPLDYTPPKAHRANNKYVNTKRQCSRTPDRTPPRLSRNNISPVRQHQNNERRRENNSPISGERNRGVRSRKHQYEEKSKPLSSSRRRDATNTPSPPPSHKPKVMKTLDGKKAGLQDAKALNSEAEERRRQEKKLFEELPSDISGRNAEVQVRSTGRLGRKAKRAREESSTERKKREEFEKQTDELFERWGKGLQQIEDHRNLKAMEAYEGSKPLARYADDEDLERFLKEQERPEDPMLEYMRQRRKEKDDKANVPKAPVYEGPYPQNRFGIRPGYRWDGVDRSNGFEKKWFTAQNAKKALQEEAYKYSIEDM